MRLVSLALGLSVLVVGCQQPDPRLNAPPHGPQPVVTSEMRETYDAMVDNGLLTDMTIADVHFVPQRPMLNSLGIDRLSRLAALVNSYGGVIRFDSAEADSALVDARMKTIREFLGTVGLPAEAVVRDLPASRGMEAAEAVRLKDAAFNPKKTGTADPAAANGSATPSAKSQ